MNESFFAKNIQYLRKKKGIKQSEIQDCIGFVRNTWSNWENQRSEPSIDNILKISHFFDIEAGDLLTKDLSNVLNSQKVDIEKKQEFVPKKVLNNVPNEPNKGAVKGVNKGTIFKETDVREEAKVPYITSRMPKVVTVDSGGNDNIVHVPIKARAGYLLGYGDPEYISQLPAYRIPQLRNGTFRSFEVSGVSMTPGLMPGDYVIGEWCESLTDIRDDRVYIVVTKTLGVVIKRVLNRIQERGKLYLKSDTMEYREQYPTIELDPSEVEELWYSRLRLSSQFGVPGGYYKQMNDLVLDVVEVKKEIQFLKQLKSN